MTKRKIKTLLVLLVCFLLLGGFLQFMSTSISLGQPDQEHIDPEKVSLQPGHFYLVKVRSPMKLTDEMDIVQAGYFAQGFIHDGKRQDNPEKHCGGDITSLLQDDGRIKYRCEKCRKIWDQTSDNKEGIK